jgi:hypothetical protein
LADELGLLMKEYFKNENKFQRHFLSSIWTLKILFVYRPQVIVIQYSFLLLILTAIYKLFRLRRIKLVVDCHTKALRRQAKGILNFIFWPIKIMSFKGADLTLISNEGLIPDIKKLHSNFIILPDKIPNYIFNLLPVKNEKYCVYVSSFAVDEPIKEILEVANILRNKIKLYWTGKFPPYVKDLVSEKNNVILTGYLKEDQYFSLIQNADCILAMTTEEDCLQSAAYEALAVEVPFVVSKTKALMKFFEDAAIFTTHTPVQIAKSIEYAIENKVEIIVRIKKVREAKENEFREKIRELKQYLDKE